MRGSALALCVSLWAGVLSAPLAAQDGVACLQNQLKTLGLDPGDADGTMRPSVRAAADDVPDTGALPLLQRRTAMSWCRALGTRDPQLRVFWPSEVEPDINAPTPTEKTLLRATDAVVRAYFRDTYDIELATHVAWIGAQDPAYFDTAINDVLRKKGRTNRTRPLDTDRLCRGRKIGGAANRGYMMFCWPGGLDSTKAQDLRPVAVHEYTHQVQYAFAADDPPQRVDGKWVFGPDWMVEGLAEVVEWQFKSGSLETDGTALFDLQSRARRSRLTLQDLSDTGSVETPEAYGVARFAAYMLVQAHGTDAAFDYFRALGEGLGQDSAFIAAFDMSFQEFERDFEAVRRDYGAARRYGRETQ